MEIAEISKIAVGPRSVERQEGVQPIADLVALYASAVHEVGQPDQNTTGHTDDHIREGSRNNALFSLAGTMRDREMSEDAIFAALMVENEAKCDPLLPESEVKDIARGVGRYKPKRPVRMASASDFAFPLEVLPPTLKRLVEEASAAIGCPPDFVAVPVLGTLGAAIGNSYALKINGDWAEGATLYTAIVGDPGAKKSPALKVATAPAWAKQAELRREYDEAMSVYHNAMRRWEAEKREASKTAKPAPEPPKKPVLKRTVINDTTVEALISRLEDNPRGLLSSNDELSGWVRQMDQYKSGKGSDRQFWLSTWSNSPTAQDRKGSEEPLMVHRPFVGIVGAIQPGILPELKNNRDDGLLERFLFAFPDSVPSRYTYRTTSEEAKHSYKRLYDELHNTEVDTDQNGNPVPRSVPLTLGAEDAFAEAVNSLGEEMDQPGFPEYLRGTWSKMEGYIARLSLVLGIANIADSVGSEKLCAVLKGDPVVGAKDVKAAIALAEYFKAHARRVYAKLHGEKPEELLANTIRGFLDERGGYWEGKTSDLYEAMKARFAPGLPGSDGPFGKRIRSIANSDNGLVLKEGHSGKDHIIKLSLSTLGAVGGADTSARTEGTEGRNGDAKTDEGVSRRFSKIIEAIDQLFKDSPEHKDEPEPDLMAMELFYSEYLDFYPEDEEIEQALKLRVGA